MGSKNRITWKLTKKQVQRLALTSETHDAELTHIGAGAAHTIADGGVIFVFEDGRGIRYESRTELQGMLEDSAAKSRAQPLDDIIPSGKAFVENVSAIAAQVQSQLGLPTQPPLTASGLKTVETALMAVSPRKRLSRTTLAPVVAFVGEFMRAETRGEWSVLPGDREPVIVAHDGALLQPFILVYRELYEYGKHGSIVGVILGDLASYR